MSTIRAAPRRRRSGYAGSGSHRARRRHRGRAPAPPRAGNARRPGQVWRRAAGPPGSHRHFPSRRATAPRHRSSHRPYAYGDTPRTIPGPDVGPDPRTTRGCENVTVAKRRQERVPMTTDPGAETELTVDELATRVGMTVRNV